MKRKHKFIIHWSDWSNEYVAYSDSIGPENSPYCSGESPTEALELLIDELEEIEKRSDPT